MNKTERRAGDTKPKKAKEEEVEIPDEFSAESDNNMEEFVEQEEEFEARQSISSRGSIGRATKNRDNAAKAKPIQDSNPQRAQQNYEMGRGTEFEHREGDESSVITEIVEEKVIEIEDEAEPHHKTDYSNDRDQRIREYLNVDKDEYLNRNEYEDIANQDGTDEWAQNSNDAGSNIYSNEKNSKLKYQPKDNSPIPENNQLEEMTETPIEIKHYANTNNKLHLVWERERLQRK